MSTETAETRVVPGGLGRIVWLVALSWAILFTVLAGLFTAGYALDDPGGLAGIGLVLLWLVPLLGGSLLAWRWPPLAYRLLLVVAVLAVGLGLWQLLDPISLRDFEDKNGPITAIGSFITMVPIALIWRVQRWPAALLMLTIAIAGLLPELRSGFHLGSSAAVAVPMLLEATLLALAAALAPRR
jgi:hypothetical protein